MASSTSSNTKYESQSSNTKYESLFITPPTAVINKTKWKMMLAIEKAVRENGGNIFGGYVRDKIKHDDAAEKFYESMRKDGIFGGSAEFQHKYNDVAFLPEHNSRRLIPSDVDCFMSSLNLVNMKKALEKKKFNVKVKRSGSANRYFFLDSRNNDISSLCHTKLSVTFDCNDLLSDMLCLKDFMIEVDVIHTDSVEKNMYDILSSNLDFECNALIITPDNEYKLAKSIGIPLNPKEKMEKINSIISDIKNDKAIVIQENNIDVPVYRWEKMMAKGWKICAPYFEIMKDEPYDGHCIICHGEIETDKHHIKDCGCDARFHMSCYLKMNRHDHFKNECPMCKGYCTIKKTEEIIIERFARRQGEFQEDQRRSPPSPSVNLLNRASVMSYSDVARGSTNPSSMVSGMVPRNLTQDFQAATNDVVDDSDDDMPSLISEQ